MLKSFCLLILVCLAGPAKAQSKVQTESSPVYPATTPVSLPAWLDRISLSGDLRVRMEQLQGAVSTTKPTGKSTNTRGRVRGRLKLTGKVNDQMTAVLRLTTGGVGKAPYSYGTNANLGSGANSKKEFDLDQVYVDYRPSQGLQIQAGKAQNLFWEPGTSEITWGFPWNQEGLNVKYQADLGDFKPFATLTYAAVYESGSSGRDPDVTMLGGQIGAPFKLGAAQTTAALGSYSFNNVKGTALTNISETGEGNSIVNGFYKYDYKLVDAGLEVRFDLGFAPLSFYGHYLLNSAISEHNQGRIAGVKLGALKDVGTWFVEYSYRDVDSDAAFAIAGETYFLLTGTDVWGHVARTAYQAWGNAALALEYNGGKRSGVRGELWMLDLVTSF